jgi:hypothetical protein
MHIDCVWPHLRRPGFVQFPFELVRRQPV